MTTLEQRVSAATSLDTMVAFLRPYVDSGISVPHSIASAMYEELQETRDLLDQETDE